MLLQTIFLPSPREVVQSAEVFARIPEAPHRQIPLIARQLLVLLRHVIEILVVGQGRHVGCQRLWRREMLQPQALRSVYFTLQFVLEIAFDAADFFESLRMGFCGNSVYTISGAKTEIHNGTQHMLHEQAVCLCHGFDHEPIHAAASATRADS